MAALEKREYGPGGHEGEHKYTSAEEPNQGQWPPTTGVLAVHRMMGPGGCRDADAPEATDYSDVQESALWRHLVTVRPAMFAMPLGLKRMTARALAV
ncbi:MAG: hypothetical protein ACRERE_11705 [Candidatus Entotheonellia bacterium]